MTQVLQHPGQLSFEVVTPFLMSSLNKRQLDEIQTLWDRGHLRGMTQYQVVLTARAHL